MNAAFVIGCSEYEDPDIVDLSYAHQDAINFANLLRSTCGLREDEMVTLHDGQPDPHLTPTRTNILRYISRGQYIRESTPIDLLFFFFSGHGFRSTLTHADYLLTRECLTTAVEETALQFDAIVRWLTAWQARHVLLFLDACRATASGGKSAVAERLPKVDVASLCPPGMVSFCSCEPGRSSYESDELRAGIFTAGLCEALSDRGKCKTIYELDTYLTETIPLLSRRFNLPIQHPHTRVEPLGVQRLELVSSKKRNEWRAATPIGAEIRSSIVGIKSRSTAAYEAPICAIDFGTSYSAIAFLDDTQTPVLIPSPEGNKLVPSVLNFTSELDYVVGLPALDADRHRPEATVRHSKRSLGTSTLYEIEGRSLAPEFAASLIIRSLKRNAEEFLGSTVERVLASYPANFNIAQCNALARAFELADLEVVRMVGEPNVSSFLLAHADRAWEGECLIVDLGGGTFDAAILSGGEGVLEMVAVSGSNTIGGLDYDVVLATYVEQYVREHITNFRHALTPGARRQIMREAERAKRALGMQDHTSVLLQDLEVDDRGLRDVDVPIDRELFRALTTDLNAKIEQTIHYAFSDWYAKTQKGPNDIDVILLAGQGSKIFTVREALERFHLKAPLITNFQESAVVHGLSYQAGVLSGKVKDMLLLDVTHGGIGFRCRQEGESVPSVGLPSMGKMDSEPCIVSYDERENSATLKLIEPSAFKPNLAGARILVETTDDRPVMLQIVEPAKYQGLHDETVGVIPILPSGTRSEFELRANIDANNTMLLTVVDCQRKSIREYQLTNLYHLDKGTHGTMSANRIEAVLDGFVIWPVLRITDPQDVSGEDPFSADKIDIGAELRYLDERIAALQGESPPLARLLADTRLGLKHHRTLRTRLLEAKHSHNAAETTSRRPKWFLG